MGNCCENQPATSSEKAMGDFLKRYVHHRTRSHGQQTGIEKSERIVYYDSEMYILVMRIRKECKIPDQVQRHLNLALYSKLHPNAYMDPDEKKEFEFINFLHPLTVLSPNLWESMQFDWECKQGYHLEENGMERYKSDEHNSIMQKIFKIFEEKYNNVTVALEEEKRNNQLDQIKSQASESQNKVRERERYEHKMFKDCLQNKHDEERALNYLKYGRFFKGYDELDRKSVKRRLDFDILAFSRYNDQSTNLEEDHINDEKLIPMLFDINSKPLSDFLSPAK